MVGGIDHLVIAVHGLDRARSVYERLGFTVTPKARHPFGTVNSLVQLDGCFIELLAIEDPHAIPVPKPGEFSFARFHQRYLDRHQGMSMLVLQSDNADDDAHAFARAGIQSYLPFEFGRDALQPDGSRANVAFRLAFATDPFIPEAGFFACEHRTPTLFWKPEYQQHANAAKRISEVVMIADAPTDHHAFFQAFTGNRDLHATSLGLKVETPGGRVSIITPDAARAMWGDAIRVADYRTPRFAAFAVAVGDIAAARACIGKAGIPAQERPGRLVVPASEAMDVAIAFEADQEQGR